MKITKSQLKQIIKEELESVTEMFGRDLDVPKYDDDLKMGGEKEYDRIIQTIKELLEAGVHFGHQTRRWNPKMSRYIFGERNGIYIINLENMKKNSRFNFR